MRVRKRHGRRTGGGREGGEERKEGEGG